MAPQHLPPSLTIDSAIERLYDPRADTTTRDGDGTPHEKPHKPLLLLAAFDLIEQGLAAPDRIPWCQALRERFTARFEVVRKLNDRDDPALAVSPPPDQRLLASPGGGRQHHPAPRSHLRADSDHVFARFTGGFEILTAAPANRRRMREALVSRYFPHAASALLGQPTEPEPERAPLAADDPDEPVEYGRSPAFRRTILEIYDHQCAACGLRIRLPAGNHVSFIDAANLIPFSESRNDHPTKAPRRAVAQRRRRIPQLNQAPGNFIQPRHSNGTLLQFQLSIFSVSVFSVSVFTLQSLLLPKDRAFHPDAEGLEWRRGKLTA